MRPTDLHRPPVDELTRPNPDDPTGRSTMRRVTDVLDCWFESGSMPFAQVHYPFENRERFEDHFPADFIVEYIGQTRGWFYTLHVLATALFDQPPFLTCVAHGIVLGDDGQKMSKRLRNYPDPDAMFAKYGADAMRWFLLSSPVLRGGDLIVDEKGIVESVRSVIHPLWNAWYFFTLYANAEGRPASTVRTDAPGVLDRYILAKGARHGHRGDRRISTATTCPGRATPSTPSSTPSPTGTSGAAGTGSGERRPPRARRLTAATPSTPWPRCSRSCAGSPPRCFPSSPSPCGGASPAGADGPSVHLADWPAEDYLPADADLVASMDRVREVCSAAHSVRKAKGLRARLPLASLTVAAPDADRLAPFVELIADEVNVKEVRLTTDVDLVADRVLTVVFKVAAPRLGPLTPQVAAAAKRGDWELLDGGRARVGEAVLEPEEFERRLRPRSEDASRGLPGNDGLVLLDVEVSDVLEAEGMARDLVRAVQQARRDAGLQVTDRIHLELSVPAAVAVAVEGHRAWVAEQTLAVDLEILTGEDAPADQHWQEGRLPDGRAVWLRVRQA